jgi:pimeloyl-ACP methyl ester carboxylesterase
MAVEWLRSAYSSKWHLFRDDLTITTAGRYYFSPEGTPFFPGWHNLGSRTWQDANWQRGQGLGEDVDEPEKWNDGDLPAVEPDRNYVGALACIADGELGANGIPADSMINGFPPACFRGLGPPATPFDEASDYDSCSVQMAYARIIEWMYDFNELAILNFLAGFLGPTFTVRVHPPTTLLPSVVTAVSTAYTLAWVDGTANFQQFAFQAAYGGVVPQNFGAYGTSTFWYDAGTYIHNTLVADGAISARPIFLCGHSYGGAAALNVVARYRVGNPSRIIRYLTFGCPRPGDVRMRDLIALTDGKSLCNYTDIVAAIPPAYDLVFSVYAALGFLFLLTWPTWKPAPQQYMMDFDGALIPGGVPTLDFTTIYDLALLVAASLPYPTIEAHQITTYRSQIFRRCSSAEWPLTPAEYTELLADDFILLEIGDPILLEIGDPILLEF